MRVKSDVSWGQCIMQNLNLTSVPEAKSDLPIRAIQFGEGVFLRSFIDWILYKANAAGVFNGRVLALQCTHHGKTVPVLKAQDCLYTVVVKADSKNILEKAVVNTIADAKNPYDDWEGVLRAGVSKDVKFIFSNTTEAGVVYKTEQPFNTDICPETYPGKLTCLLYERFKALGRGEESGVFVLPCELIDNNADKLKGMVLQHIEDQHLGPDFKDYILNDCTFVNTLVDRICSPAGAVQASLNLPYEDKLTTICEGYYFYAVEGGEKLKAALPLDKAGLNVKFVDSLDEIRKLKVRILNGAHTGNAPAGVMRGLTMAEELMHNEETMGFLRSMVYNEIIPATDIDAKKQQDYADSIMKRFDDSACEQSLVSILMNTSAKVKSRLLPTILDARAKGVMPKKLCFAIAAYIAMYKNASGIPVKLTTETGVTHEFMDDEYAVGVLQHAWTFYQKTEASAMFVVKAVLSDVKLWDCDLSSDIDFTSLVSRLLHAIISDGVAKTEADLMLNE